MILPPAGRRNRPALGLGPGRSRFTDVRRVLCRALGAAIIAGCALPDSATGGLTLELNVKGEGQLAVLYRVNRDGTLGFGGGADARNCRISWTGPMTADEIKALRSLLDRHGWFSHGPASTGEPPQREYRIKLTWEGGRRRYTVKGASPDVTPIDQLLERIARRRLDPFLDSLPRPSHPEDEGPGQTTPDTQPAAPDGGSGPK